MWWKGGRFRSLFGAGRFQAFPNIGRWRVFVQHSGQERAGQGQTGAGEAERPGGNEPIRQRDQVETSPSGGGSDRSGQGREAGRERADQEGADVGEAVRAWTFTRKRAV